MQIQVLQSALSALGYDIGKVDGIAGRRTMAAVDKLLAQSDAGDWMVWTDERRRVAVEQIIYKNAKIEVGEIDGLVGEQTRYARSVWEARQLGPSAAKQTEKWRDEEKSIEPVTKVSKRELWPRQKDVQSFYGAPGAGMTTFTMPFPLRLAWEPAKELTTISCHTKCKQGFLNIWTRTLKHYGHEQIRKLRLDYFGGCVNVRRMRGGSRWSMHAFGCAWDIDPDRNQLKWTRAQATLDDTPYKPFWDIVYDEGALSLGMERNYDWMHFQFTSDLS